ncbi:MAG TPA: DnaD domain protein [Anaerolineales bacterium]|jgi:DnaD/phage-associated family protein|nr:DnaD domain protein [Anaerolineales bacterium]
MKPFKGFTDSESFTQLPDTFFHQLLNQIDNAEELKVTLYFLWRVEHMDGPFHALREEDFDTKALGLSTDEMRSGLEKAVQRGSILKAEKGAEAYFFLNSPRGRAVVQAIESGTWNPESTGTTVLFERPNIFRLYEENIGPLTPLIADALKDAEETYSPEWVAETIDLAVRNNKRSWRYCEAILKRWKEEGRGEKQDRRDSEKDRDKYIKGEYADYIEH